jgi:LmbE family N-acetylglucosaminyl deacetylase
VRGTDLETSLVSRQERIAVVSPHLDDAVFSLGAFMARASRRGAAVRVITVFAGDPARADPPSEWDRRCGFASGIEAVQRRRAEDAAACRLVGATAVWLPFSRRVAPTDRSYEAVGLAVADAAASCGTILLPGYPLFHPDHAFVTRLLLRDHLAVRRVGLYVEQPYAAWKWTHERGAGREPPAVTPALAELLPGLGLSWNVLRASPIDWARKTRASLAYRSQFRALGRLAVPRVLAYEARSLGERVAWLPGS